MSTNVLGESFVTLLDWVLRWWVADRGPGLAFIAEHVSQMRPVVRWASAATLALTITTAAVVLIVARKGAHLAELLVGLGRFLLVLSAGWLVLAAGWSASQSLARWILGGDTHTTEYSVAVTDALAAAEPAIAASMSVVGAATALTFAAVVLLRAVMATVLAVTAPVIAAASLLAGGSRLRILGAWMLAVLAFRPLACLIYRMSHDLVTTSGDPVVVLLAVPLTLVLSALMLPLVAAVAAGTRPV